MGIDGTALLDARAAQTIASLYAADFELTGTDPAAFTMGEPVYLDSVAQGLLRLAAERSRRTVQISRTYQTAPPSSAARIRRLLGGRSRDRG